MPTSPQRFIERGMSPPQAEELALQIDQTAASAPGFPNVPHMKGLGIPTTLANELAAQMNTPNGQADRLMGVGVPPLLAEEIALAIDASVS